MPMVVIQVRVIFGQRLVIDVLNQAGWNHALVKVIESSWLDAPLASMEIRNCDVGEASITEDPVQEPNTVLLS